MEQGELVEFGSPSELINKPNGVFANMVESLGPEASLAVKNKAAGIKNKDKKPKQ
jgi:hypothetical protein